MQGGSSLVVTRYVGFGKSLFYDEFLVEDLLDILLRNVSDFAKESVSVMQVTEKLHFLQLGHCARQRRSHR